MNRRMRLILIAGFAIATLACAGNANTKPNEKPSKNSNGTLSIGSGCMGTKNPCGEIVLRRNDWVQEAAPRPVERMLASVPRHDRHAGIVLDYQGEGIAYEIENVGACLEDLGVDPPRDSGIYIWEGTVDYYQNSWDYDSDISWHGKWREPTVDEWWRIIQGKGLWYEEKESENQQLDRQACG